MYASLRSAASEAGGWDAVLTEARAHDPSSTSSPSDTSMSLDGGTPQLQPGPNGTQRSYIDGEMAVELRKRLDAATARGATEKANSMKAGVDSTEAQKLEQPDFAVMIYHPDENIASLAHQLLDMSVELTGPLGKVRWPDNISWTSFADYMLIPTLVYDLEYPRTDR